MLFTAIDHPAMSCTDVQKQVDWYCNMLEMKVIGTDGKVPASFVLSYQDNASGGAVLEIMPARDAGASPASYPRFCPGLRHMAFRVSSFEQAYQRLQKAGVTFLFEPTNAAGGGKIVSFRDPEGNELQIVER